MPTFTQPAGVWQQMFPGAQALAPLHEHLLVGPVFLHASPGTHSEESHWQRLLALSQVPPEPPTWHCALLVQPQRLAPAAPQTSPDPWSAHELEQPPQLWELCEASSSQPSSEVGAAGLLQLAAPRTQLDVQTPPAQASESTPWVLHARPQAPQWSVLVATLASQPSDGSALQSWKPGTQEKPQAPAEQVVTALSRDGQRFPQEPQLAGLVVRSTHWPSQLTRGAVQPPPQLPLLQVSPVLHLPVQLPQWSGSLDVSTHSAPHLA